MDLDNFKSVNDLRGHEAGDSVLIETTVRMKSMLRSQDTVARWGGDEFAVLLPGNQLGESLFVVEKIRRRMGDSPFFVCGKEMRITASWGVAEFNQRMGTEQMLKVADEALYTAKKTGATAWKPAPPLRLPGGDNKPRRFVSIFRKASACRVNSL